MAHMRMTSKGNQQRSNQKQQHNKDEHPSHDKRMAFHTTNKADGRKSEGKREATESLQTQFLKATFKPFSVPAEKSIPASVKTDIMSLFSQAWKKRNDPIFAESKLLEAMNLLPENPFIATRLVCFYKGIGKDRDALEMAAKAQNLAARQKIPTEILLG